MWPRVVTGPCPPSAGPQPLSLAHSGLSWSATRYINYTLTIHCNNHQQYVHLDSKGTTNIVWVIITFMNSTFSTAKWIIGKHCWDDFSFDFENKYSGGHQDLRRSKTLNISFKCCSKFKSRDSFGNCSSWRFQNTPNMLRLIEFWLRYLTSKTNDMILKNSSKLIQD